jgi:hypothetical protein
MTKEEQNIVDDKMRAEIALALDQAAKTRAETAMINVETSYYVLFRGIALGAGLMAAGAAFSKLFL